MDRTRTLLDLPAATTARVLCLRRLDEAAAAAERVRDRSDPDALHDLRVALRRLRSTVRAFRSSLDDTLDRRDRKRLHGLLAATSNGRDAQAQAAWVERLLADDPDARAACAPLLESLSGDGGAELARARKAVRRRFPPLARALRRSLAGYSVAVDPTAPAGPEGTAPALRAALERTVGELRTRLADLDASAPAEATHRARVAVKRLRYLLEPFERELQGGREALHSLRALQTLFGDLHDLDVLAAAVATAEEGGASEGVHRLSRRLRMRREESARALANEWLAGDPPAFLTRIEELAAHLASGGDGVEIERKFLLRDFPALPAAAEEIEVEQGWFGTRYPERVRRMRAEGGYRCYRAIKHGAGVTRMELEEPIDAGLFAALWPLTEGRRVRKVRYRVREGELLWEIDRFTDRDLVLAEVELPAADHPIAFPAWLEPHLVREVTDEPGYVNLNLAR